ncbi:unnamed protein product [Angiostrongylus costaricensis]|uniref:Transcription initiation factor TFIID subunit 8 n=1 Tax=Angiostrongylus costaricensis TaxID=334426 RepID=A0A158PJB7_ANGCS|nr:unnamed protein product [Angiostrongylus costaricensis]
MKRKSLPPLLPPVPKSPAYSLSNLFASLFGKVPAGDLQKKWSTTYSKMLELSEVLERNEKLPGARVYNMRAYDLVMDSDKNKPRKATQKYAPPELKTMFDFVNSFDGEPSSRFLSPRIAPLIPEKRQTKGFLSPSLFPFYKDNTEEQILPIPKVRMLRFELFSGFLVLEDVGLKEKDREKVLHTIMEVTGARETMDKAMVAMLKEYDVMPRVNREEALWEAIGKIAGKMHRQKRQLKALQPSFLSPAIFTPVYGPSILGPVALSPSLFSPVFLAPNVLSPGALSPGIGNPVFLSPFVLSPEALSPSGLAATVLSPNALSPSILNPSFLTTSILSPFALSPSILSPSVLGASVLSPNAFSPDVLSKSYLHQSVLSPSFMS